MHRMLRNSVATIGLVALLAGTATASESDVSPEGFSSSLQHRAYRTWNIELPEEKWFRVSGGIPIAHANGESFPVATLGLDLLIDSNGDGSPDRTIRAKADDYGVRRARVMLKGARDDGSQFTYGIRLQDAGRGWHWAPGGAMVGSLDVNGHAEKVQVIDANGNGRFDDIGEDAMIIGQREIATYLSSTVSLNGELWNVDVDEDGTDISLSLFEGERAELNMTAGFASKARLLSAVIRSTDGAHSFDMGSHDSSLELPAGSYEIINGAIGLGQQRVAVTAGRASLIELESGSEATFDWGGPVSAEFAYQREGDQVVFSPDAIWYYGDAGEQYLDWTPLGKSPQFTIRDQSSGEVLEVLILPGSC